MKKTYYTIGITTTAIAALIYMGFLLGSVTAYWTTCRRSQQRTPRQGRI